MIAFNMVILLSTEPIEVTITVTWDHLVEGTISGQINGGPGKSHLELHSDKHYGEVGRSRKTGGHN